MRNYVQRGESIPATAPSGGVTAGVGVLLGAHLFGVAQTTAAEGVAFELQTEGVVDIAKTSALAIAAGDLLYWDATNKVVNKTASSQKLVGVAVAAAANPSATVRMKLLPNGVAVA